MAPLLIAAGLTGLLASILFPAVPVVTAMAVLTLGATNSTLARFRGSSALPTLMLAHAAVYLSLYVLLIGATLHAALPTLRLSVGTALDLVASILPMALAIRSVVGSLPPQFGPQR
jgi:hypothetical protein